MVASFKRGIVDEVLAEQLRTHSLYPRQLVDSLIAERNYIESYTFDLRVLAFAEEAYDALKRGRDKEWLRLMNKAKQIVKDADIVLGADSRTNLVLIDRIDDAWDGSDSAVLALMATMHACVEMSATCERIRPMLFLRENIFERVRAIDPEFTRLETCVVSLDWTRQQLQEMVERRLQLPLNPKPPLGETWKLLFDMVGSAPASEMILDYCQQRPRDVLTYCSLAVESAQASRHQRVTVEDMDAAKVRFSESRLKDLGDEYSENFPQIQLVLNRFHGLATEFTVPAVTAFIQKLLADSEVMSYCGQWLSRVAAPHLFIELLYSIGFWGIRSGAVVEYRGVGLRSASPPTISSSSTVVIHPSLARALDLQAKVIGDLEDIVLQREGLLLELPEAIDLEQYQERLRRILTDLDATPTGNDYDDEYERIVGEVIRLCFFRWLNNLEPHRQDNEGRVIRDWIAANVAEQGFWQLMKDKYDACQVIWECKNKSLIEAADFHQAEYYMNSAIGRLVILCFRGDDIEKHHYQHIRRISEKLKGMVLILRDRDLKVFVRQAINQKVKEEHIRQLFDTTIRNVS
ncbi:MAG: transposase [Planctomycetota bacterium]|nr:MAG: transposase [Planctomycetota bacterium]